MARLVKMWMSALPQVEYAPMVVVRTSKEAMSVYVMLALNPHLRKHHVKILTSAGSIMVDAVQSAPTPSVAMNAVVTKAFI